MYDAYIVTPRGDIIVFILQLFFILFMRVWFNKIQFSYLLRYQDSLMVPAMQNVNVSDSIPWFTKYIG